MAGQIVKRGDRTYTIRVSAGRDSVTGRRLTVNKTIHGTKRQAEEELTKLLREKDTGLLIRPSKATVAEYMERWLATKVNVRERTRDDYKATSDRHIVPALGSIRLEKLTPLKVQEFLNSLTAHGKGPRTVKLVRDILHMALSHAVVMGELARVPTDRRLVALPRLQRRAHTILDPEQVKAFLSAARNDRWEALWFLLVTGGLRPSEALALTWSDFDAERCEVRVTRTLSWIPRKGWRFEQPKTQSSARRIPLPSTAALALRRHQKRQFEEQLKAGANYADHHLIFATRLGKPVEYRRLVQLHFKKLLKAAGLPAIRPYDLRHTCATLALYIGGSIKVVSERLGHSNIKMTLDTYQHVLPHMQNELAADLEKLLFAPAKEAGECSASG